MSGDVRYLSIARKRNTRSTELLYVVAVAPLGGACLGGARVIGRRRFLGFSAVGITAAVGVLDADPALAATTAKQWRWATWSSLVGATVKASSSNGRKTSLVVASITAKDTPPAGTVGESFIVRLTTGSATLTDGQYKLAHSKLGGTATGFLLGGGPGHATLVVNNRVPS